MCRSRPRAAASRQQPRRVQPRRGGQAQRICSSSKIGDADAAAIAQALKVNGALTKLFHVNGVLTMFRLSSSKIGDAGATAIAQAGLTMPHILDALIWHAA